MDSSILCIIFRFRCFNTYSNDDKQNENELDKNSHENSPTSNPEHNTEFDTKISENQLSLVQLMNVVESRKNKKRTSNDAAQEDSKKRPRTTPNANVFNKKVQPTKVVINKLNKQYNINHDNWFLGTVTTSSVYPTKAGLKSNLVPVVQVLCVFVCVCVCVCV